MTVDVDSGSSSARRRWLWALATALTAAAALAEPGAAPAPPVPASTTPTASLMSAAEAARLAREQNGGGRVLSVEVREDGYAVKLLKDGDIRIVFVPQS